MAAGEVAERDDLTEQMDACNQKKSYIQDQITEVQGQIVALDENKVRLFFRLNVQAHDMGGGGWGEGQGLMGYGLEVNR